jgi:hypothetical protein
LYLQGGIADPAFFFGEIAPLLRSPLPRAHGPESVPVSRYAKTWRIAFFVTEIWALHAGIERRK